jgi:hypothetical protein
VPHLFIGSGATVFNDPEHYPWSMSWTPHYASEAEIYAKYILSVKPDAKIGILSQNDDPGRDYLLGFKRGLGEKASTMIVSTQTYNTSDPTVDSQVVSLKASGADVVTVPKFSAQAIRKAYDIDWHRRNSSSASAHRLRARSGRPGLKQQKASSLRPIKRIRPTAVEGRSGDESVERWTSRTRASTRAITRRPAATISVSRWFNS